MVREWIADSKVPGLGILQLPSGVRTWYLRYREPGGKQQHHRIGRADVVSRTLAREEAHKLLAAVATGQAPTSARQERRRAPTIAQLLERIKREHWPRLRPGTVANNELIWRLHLLPVFGSTKVVELQRRQVIAWFNVHSADRPTRANRSLEVLSKAMSLAELWELRPQGTNPCSGVIANIERKRRRYLSRDELQRLLTALDQLPAAGIRWRFGQMVRLLLFTGCRVREIMCARWCWLDEGAARLTLPPEAHKTGGDGSERVVHLPPAAMAILRRLRCETNSEWIIAGDGNGPLVSYWRMWSQLIAAAGIQNLRIHDLRHNYASLAISAGLTLPQIGGLLGHASPQTTQRYAHLIDESAAAAAALVAGQIKNPAG